MAAIKDHASDDAGFTKISLSRHNLANSGVVDSSEGVGLKGQMSNTTDRYQVGILDGYRNRQIRSLRLQRHRHRSW